MEIFAPGEQSQTLTIIPRYQSEIVTLSLRRDESGKLTFFEQLPTLYSDGYLSMDFTYDFKDKESYSLEVTTPGGDLLWRGMAYATSQNPQDYKINADIIQL